MDKNEKEKNLLYEWGVTNCFNYSFPQIDKDLESYFLSKKGNSYLKEYSFGTLPELMNILELLYENNEIMLQILKVVGVAAIKNKPIKIMQQETGEENKKHLENGLPAFIYNF